MGLARREVVDDEPWELSYGPQAWGYRVHCPRTPSGIAVIGDLTVFATVGRGRVRDIAPIDGGVRLRVLGPGEKVTIAGVAPSTVSAIARTTDGSRSLEVVSSGSGRFDVAVEVGPQGWTQLELRV